MPVLVDSNVLIDLTHRDSEYFHWSQAQVSLCIQESAACINPLIYAEVAAAMEPIEALDAFLDVRHLKRLPLPYEAAVAAGRAYRTYRRRGGSKTSPLPDFYIGAHAQVAGLTLLTRDVRRYRSYFPEIELISPE